MGTEADFSEVYKEFQPKILYYVASMTGIDKAEDISQEVFQKISLSLEDIKGESNLSTWIYRIATNAALDRFRSKTFKIAVMKLPL